MNINHKSITLIFILCFFTCISICGQSSEQELFNFNEKLDTMYNYAWNDPEVGIIEARKLQKEAQEMDYAFGYCCSVLLEADCNISKGNYAQAIQILFKARDLAAKANDPGLFQRVERPLGKLYILLGDKKKAINHQKMAIARSGDQEEVLIATHGLGESYYRTGELDSALMIAEKMYKQVGQLWSAPVILLGDTYVALEEYEKAQEVFKTKPQLYFLIDSIDIIVGKARAFYGLNEIDSARYYAEEALQLANEKGFYRLVREASDLLALSYKDEDLKKYTEYLEINYAAKDTLFGLDKIYTVFDLMLEDESKRRDLVATQLKTEARQKSIIFIAIASFLLIGGLLLYRNNRLKTTSNLLLSKEKQNVEDALIKLKNSEKINKELRQQEMDRMKEVDEMKTKFYTNITHEFRTPLTVIIGMNQNIKEHELEKRLIRRNADSLLQLINQLLDLSKFDSGYIEVENRKGDIVSYIHYLTESFYSMATDKRVHLSFHPKPQNLEMDFDEQRLKHIIYNLLSNAIKFTRAGGKVTVNTDLIEGEVGSKFMIKIKDTGVGISEEELPHIFDRFYQSDNATSSGTGIGLALTKEIVKLLKGEISVKSEEGWGTEFTILLPYLNESETSAMGQQFDSVALENRIDADLEVLPATADQLNGAKPRILIVEDSPGVVTYIKSVIEDSYDSIVAVNGQEGIELAMEHIPDIIITDVMMPEKNGFDLSETLKKDERTSHIPIVMLTAKADLNSKIQGLETGVDAYLAKPFEKEELQVRLKKLIELRQNLQEKYTSRHFSSDSIVDSPDLEDEFLIKVKDIIHANLDHSELNVSEVSKHLHISHTQLYRKIKALTGITPTQFIRKVRLKKSIEYLLSSSMSIAEIAYSSGFSDPNYFSRVFKKEFDKTPGEIRSEVKN